MKLISDKAIDLNKILRMVLPVFLFLAAGISYFVLGNQTIAWRGDAAWRMASAMLLIYWLPGYLLLGILMPRKRFNALESLALSFGLSHIFIVAECVSVMLAHGNLQMAWMIHGISLLALGLGRGIVFLCFRESDSRRESEHDDNKIFILAGYVMLAVTIFLLYQAGGLWKNAPTDEEIYNLVVTRKFLDLERLNLSSIMFRKDMPSTYLFAPYQFMTALVAKASALNPLIVYTNFRAFWGLIALSSFYAIARVLTNRRDIASVCLIAGCALAISNAAGQFEETVGAVFWGQLIPVSHHADFALGVLLPVMFLFLLEALKDGRWYSSWVWITPIVIVAGILTHTREGVQVLFYGALIAVAYFVFTPFEWRRLIPFGIIAFLTVVFGKIFQAAHHDLVGHVVQHEAANRIMVESFFTTNFQKFPPLGMFTHWYYNCDLGLFRPFFSFALIFAPALLLIRDRFGWARVFWGILVIFMIIYRIPPLAWAMVKATYSEMLWTPARYISTVSFLFFGLFLFAMLPFFDRVSAAFFDRGKKHRFNLFLRSVIFADIFLFVGFVLLQVTHVAYRWGVKSYHVMDIIYLWLLVGSAFAFWIRFNKPHWTIEEKKIFDFKLRFPKPVLSALLVILIPFVLYKGSGKDLVQRAIDMKLPQGYAGEAEFYAKNYSENQPPFEMIDFIRTRIPQGKVIVYPPKTGMVPLMFLNQYAFSAGYQPFLADVDFVEKYFRVMNRPLPQGKNLFETYQLKSNLYSQLLQNEEPFFSPSETEGRLNRLIEGFGVNYVLAPESSLQKIMEVRRGKLKRAQKIYSSGGWGLISLDPQ